VEALQNAISYLSDYQYRINQDTYHGDLESRTRYENAAYHEGMLSAAIAQAEQLKRIADALENISGAYSIDLPRPAFDAWADYDRNH
jgi:phage terminase Nu1 subunit (DNA packaging protein)